jgi:hypothetical protein
LAFGKREGGGRHGRPPPGVQLARLTTLMKKQKMLSKPVDPSTPLVK